MGFLYIGSGFIIFTQMGIALSQSALRSSVIVTIIFALLPIILGIALVRVALHARSEVTMHARIKMVVPRRCRLVRVSRFDCRPGSDCCRESPAFSSEQEPLRSYKKYT